MVSAGASRLSGEEWASLWYGAELADVARGFLPLLADEPGWVERRVEQIEVLDRARVRRRVSIDFRLRETTDEARAHEEAQEIDSVVIANKSAAVPLPLGLLAKAPLRAFDIRDEVGRALVIWTREQNSELTASLLLQVAGGVLDKAGEEMSRKLAYDIARIAGTASDTCADAAWDRFISPAGDDPDARRRDLICDNHDAWRLFLELRDQFILIAELRQPLSRRRLVKVSYEEALQPPDSGFKGSATRFFRRIAESLGFAAFRVGFPVPGVLDAASYHVEVIAPEDVIIAKASLVITTEDDAEHEAAVEYRQERAHLFVSHERARWQSWDLDSATKSEVDVRFSLKPGGLVVPAVLTSALTTGLLWVGLYLHRNHIAPRPEAATAVLVVLPALYAAYLAPGRDPLVRLMSVALRFLVFCSSLIAFAAASVLAIQMKPATVAHLWSWFAGVSTGITSVFAVSLLAAWIRQKGPEWRRS